MSCFVPAMAGGAAGGGYEYYGQVQITASGTTTLGSTTKKIIGTGLLQPVYANVSTNANPSYCECSIQKIDNIAASRYNFTIEGFSGGSTKCSICGFDALYTGATSNGSKSMYLYGVTPMVPFNKNIELKVLVYHSNTSVPSNINYGYFYVDVWKKVDTEIVIQ